jgi:hypothetical protein
LCSLLQPKIIRELELDRFVIICTPRTRRSLPAFPDGRHLFFLAGHEGDAAGAGEVSKHDSEVYPSYEHKLARIAEEV